MLEFKSKGLLRVQYNGRKLIISYLYENGSHYFATGRSSRKMKHFTTVGKDVELISGFFVREKVSVHIEIMPAEEKFFNYTINLTELCFPFGELFLVAFSTF